jgi:hypothetical protein
LRGQMGEAGKRTARGYDWTLVAGRVLAYYERVIARTGTRYQARRTRAWDRLRLPSQTS